MDTCPKNYEKFVEHDKCVALIENLHNNLDIVGQDEAKTRSDVEKLVEQFKKLTDPYQEQPELLDPYLGDLVQKLTSGLNDFDISSTRYHTIFKFLYQLIKISGFKPIGKKFPHEVDKLLLIVELLSKEDTNDKINWQTRFVLTVWLSVVILTPFDLAKFDSNSSETCISDRIYSILMKSLKLHDSCQHVTAFCLAKFFSRPDMIKSEKLLNEFITISLSNLANVKLGFANSMDDIELIGQLKTMAYMFKYLPRAEMKSRCQQILDVAIKLDIEQINRELVIHLLIKLIQRSGLALLPNRLATWHYKRGSRILGQVDKSWVNDGIALNKPAKGQVAKEDDGEYINNTEEVSAAEYLESILGVLFVAAQNSQTKIRWSAAKGIARLGSRLSRERASAVTDMVLENFFNQTSSEFAWHGGCLTLAEMSRHGLIIVEKLPRVTEIVSYAIVYDKIKGSFPVGAHVREAACYVCWAMARKYEDKLLEPYIPAISINLLCTMLFDRDLQCRRAASATFQELVGRQGTFNEEGINILNNVDYQNVGQRPFAYVHLALQVASYGEKYSKPFVKHLLEKKIGHWDVQIRRLASDSLSALMLHVDLEYVKTTVLPQLIAMTDQDLDNNLKHGAILGLAKVIRGLIPLGYTFESELIDFVGALVGKCKKQLKSKQQAPNFIEAIGLIISSAEAASFVYAEDSETLKDWETIIGLIDSKDLAMKALDSDNVLLRDIGSDALLTLYRTYYKSNKTMQDRILTYLNKSLASSNESSRCGGLRALSKLSQVPDIYMETEAGSKIRIDADTPDIILMSITSYIAKNTREVVQGLPKEANDGGYVVFAQAKAEACEAFVNFVSCLDKSRLVVSLNLLQAGYEALLEKTEDYTFDKQRGDIGVVVRRAAIKAILELTLYLLNIGLTSIFTHQPAQDSLVASSEEGERGLVSRIMARIIQQAVSYNNSARELAATAFYRLIASTLPDDSIPHKAEILKLFDKFHVDDVFNWRDDSTPIFVNLLEKPEYSLDLWTGLLSSVGQVSDMCAKQFRTALSDYIVSLEENDRQEERQFIFKTFLQTLEREDMADRLIAYGLIVADFLLTDGLLSDTSEEFQDCLAKICWKSRATKSTGAAAAASLATNGAATNSGLPTLVAPASVGVTYDPKRLILVGRVMSSMLQFSGHVQRDALKCCLILLANGFAKVRASTAEQMYQAIMTYQEDLEENLTQMAFHEKQQQEQQEEKSVSECASVISQASGESVPSSVDQEKEELTSKSVAVVELDLTKAMELLSTTSWIESLDKVKPIRDQICCCMLVEPSSLLKLTSGVAVGAKKSA